MAVSTRADSPLRNLRRTRTITQADLARIVGVTQETMSKYERGVIVPSADMAALIAAVLGSTAQALFPELADQKTAAR
jgi:transcriptional regulator with XRE-family HTH domain